MSQHGYLPRLIAFYLPQYHPTAENDAWWGTGFTDWRNVVQARPLFPGHYQPHIPADLGTYDLRLPEIRDAQAELAGQYGIFGFCYYHYWFNGRQLLARPLDEVLRSGRPKFPFCLCWANENWTRRWDGRDQEVLICQEYSQADDLAHIRAILPALTDSRYIRVANRCLLLVYRTSLLPDPRRTAQIWRETALREGGVELCLARVETHIDERDDSIDPASVDFDAAVEFAPDWSAMGSPTFHRYNGNPLTRLPFLSKAHTGYRIYSYDTLCRNMLLKPTPAYRRFSCVTPSWDNTARRRFGAIIFCDSSPAKYESWLTIALTRTIERVPANERMLFVNAWNEWAEGSHLEPDLEYGRAYLESTLRATQSALNFIARE